MPLDEEKGVPVTTLKVEEVNEVSKIELFGRLYPAKDIQVFAGLDGELIALNFAEGDRVKRNDILARIKRNIPGSEYAPYDLKSPIEGTVMRRFFEEGATVGAQTVLFQIADLSCIYFRGQVFGDDRDRVRLGQTLIIEQSLGGGRLGLLVTQISPLVDEATGGVTVEAQVCFTGGSEVKPGQSVEGYIVTGNIKGVFIPREAVVKIEGVEGVFIIEESRAVFREIKTVYRNDDYFLAEGVVPGNNIILSGAQLVEEGDLLKVVEE